MWSKRIPQFCGSAEDFRERWKGVKLMTDFNMYYRAYMDMKDTLKGDFTYNYLAEKLSDGEKEKDEQTGKEYNRVIDMDWVEAIEEGLIYIDKAIREQRRFIEQNEDIVPIEKARKITSESVRHLAQHTSLIARVENDTVTPERILEIQREESFAIYENRFLRTLLSNLSRFVEDRYKNLKQAPNDSFMKVHMQREMVLNQQIVNFEMTYSNESHERMQIDMAADIETLTDFERVLRVRRIISDFSASPLMRVLSGVEPVRPPILRTNLMTKNPNFKKALDLWLFIETYKKSGFEIVGNEYTGKMEKETQREMYVVMGFQHFVLSIANNPAWRKMLHEKYLEENARREEEEEGPDKERKKLEEFRIAKIREEEMQLRLDEIRTREKQIKELKASITSQKITILRNEETIKELRGTVTVLQSDLGKYKEQAFQLEGKVAKLEREVVERQTKIEELKLELSDKEKEIEKVSAQNTVLTDQVETLTKRSNLLEKEKKQLESSLAEVKQEMENLKLEAKGKDEDIRQKAKKIEELTHTVETENAEIEKQREDIVGLRNTISSLKGSIQLLTEKQDKEILRLEGVYSNEIEELKLKHEEIISANKRRFKKEKDLLNAEMEEEKTRADKTIQKNQKALDDKLESLKSQHQSELEKVEKKAQKQIEKAEREIRAKAREEAKKTEKEIKKQASIDVAKANKKAVLAKQMVPPRAKRVAESFTSDYVKGCAGLTTLVISKNQNFDISKIYKSNALYLTRSSTAVHISRYEFGVLSAIKKLSADAEKLTDAALEHVDQKTRYAFILYTQNEQPATDMLRDKMQSTGVTVEMTVVKAEKSIQGRIGIFFI